jgi:hypothetical protein
LLKNTCGWTVTIDAFASESNFLVPRFFARYAEHAAEAEDAFTVPDWDRSVCLACGLVHPETLFAFPPPPLLNAFVAKARADGVRAIVLTPLAVTAPYWHKLLRASVVPEPKGYHRVRRSFALKDSDLRLRRRPRKRHLPPPHQLARRPLRPGRSLPGRCLAGSPSDTADRLRIHADIAAAGLALRP